MSDFFDSVKEFYPRFNVSEKVMGFWHKRFQKIERGTLTRAFERWVETHDKAPTFSTFKELLTGLIGATPMEAQKPTETPTHIKYHPLGKPVAKSKIEIAMDALGPEFVTAALKEIVGDPKTVRWSDLVSRKDWIPAYRAKVEELYQMAIQYNNAPRCQDGSDPIVAPETRFADAF